MNEDAQSQQFAERIRQFPNMCACQIFDDGYDNKLCDAGEDSDFVYNEQTRHRKHLCRVRCLVI